MKRLLSRLAIIALFTSGVALLVLNLYGFTQDLRPDGLTPEVLRFGEQDLSLTPPELDRAIFRVPGETDKQMSFLSAARLKKRWSVAITPCDITPTSPQRCL